MANIEHRQLFHLLILFSLTLISYSAIPPQDTLKPGDSLPENNTLVSNSQNFEFGFFTPGNSNSKYLGIWYKQIRLQTVVWVANRNAPILANSSAYLHFSNIRAGIELVDQKGNLIWASSNPNQPQKPISKPVLQLLDSGNLIIREESEKNSMNKYLWQSFDYPSDTLLPGMKLGWDLKTGKNRFLTSWKNPKDPSEGNYTFELNLHGSPEIYLLQNNKTRIYRSGPWNGHGFSGVPEMKPAQELNFSFVSNEDEIFYTFSAIDASIVSRLTLEDNGFLKRYVWMWQSQRWNEFWLARKDRCDGYQACGPYGICDSNDSPMCNCVKGFRPKNQREWDLRDASCGCVRETEDFDCVKGVGFLKLQGMKLPVSEGAVVISRMGLKECEQKCRKNCSCTAYASSDITGGAKKDCLIWFGDLIDMREYRIGGQDLFVRVPLSVLDKNNSSSNNNSNYNKKSVYVIVVISVTLAILIFLSTVCFLLKKDKLTESLCKRADSQVGRVKSQEIPLFNVVVSSKKDYLDDNKKDDLEMPLFNFDTIASTTNNFSMANKLGEGGFGCVYKGTLADGQLIAVKRLSRNSGQGVEELKNEVMLIARLQHRNLVRLLGCCIEREENILVYEYMQNKSLDSILFDKKRSGLLDWPKRFNIILGIARGLLYLHQDSRFRIIHRDLKASNILLDEEMIPKISDFGMARIFGGDQAEVNTRRVVGTYGYMAPEYAMDGSFSVKSDVFSYGVLVLEIISGMKNRGFYYHDNELNLLGHTWNLWEEGKGLELTDEAMDDSWSAMEVLKCIQVGLLCVQERAEDRPTMDTVILMLSSEFLKLPKPKQPGFCLGKTPTEMYTLTKQQSYTANQVTVTMLAPR